MKDMNIDLRSDTITIPTKDMLDYMFNAKVGDDVWGEDETVKDLENHLAILFSKEAALFCPSGTMTNQIAIRVHTKMGDELICDRLSHIYNYEGGGIASNSGVSARLIDGHSFPIACTFSNSGTAVTKESEQGGVGVSPTRGGLEGAPFQRLGKGNVSGRELWEAQLAAV